MTASSSERDPSIPSQLLVSSAVCRVTGNQESGRSVTIRLLHFVPVIDCWNQPFFRLTPKLSSPEKHFLSFWVRGWTRSLLTPWYSVAPSSICAFLPGVGSYPIRVLRGAWHVIGPLGKVNQMQLPTGLLPQRNFSPPFPINIEKWSLSLAPLNFIFFQRKSIKTVPSRVENILQPSREVT